MFERIVKAFRARRQRRQEQRYAVRRRGFALMVERLESREMFDAGGNTLAAATDLGAIQGARSLTEFVGTIDTNDYYRFRVGQSSDARLVLDGLSADADLQLFDANGATLGRSINGGTTNDVIQRTLPPGTYYARVYPYGSANTNYRLSFTVTPRQVSAPPDNAGNTLASARDLGVLSGTRSYADFVGRADTNDYYRFQLAGRGTLDLSLDGMSADADVSVLDSGGNMIVQSIRGSSASESIRRTLDTGTYYVRVYPYGGAETTYRLTLSVQPEGRADGSGNSIGTARDLGTLRGVVTVQDFVGQVDPADYYRFRVDSQSDIRLRMDGMTADADVQILNSQGTVLASSIRGGANVEAIDRALQAGNYYVRVYPYGSANTNYRLSLEASLTQGQGLDLTRMTPIPDYDGHLGADYAAPAGTAVFSPVAGRVIDVRPVDGYGTMAVAVEVSLPSARSFATELAGRTTSTDRLIVVFGHLRPSRDLIAHPDANYRFQQGQHELGYGVGSQITVGQRLGYVETHGYEGAGSTGSHVHVTMSNRHTVGNYWQGRGMPANDPRRINYIRPELAWPVLRSTNGLPPIREVQ